MNLWLPGPLLSAALALAVVSGLGGCAHTGQSHGHGAEEAAAAPRHGPWEGRLSLKLAATGQDSARGANMAFHLQGAPEQGELNLSTPLGTQMASVRWQKGLATLVTADGSKQFGSLDELTQHLLGEALPVTPLMSWLQGRPDPSQPVKIVQPQVFEQAGWQVDLTAWRSGHLEASRPPIPGQRGAALKVRLDS